MYYLLGVRTITTPGTPDGKTMRIATGGVNEKSIPPYAADGF